MSLSVRMLHLLDPETAHDVAIRALSKGLVPRQTPVTDPRLQMQVAGLEFPNPVGLAAGFDKNADALKGLVKQGFGFIECGTATPLPQSGNPKPRIFRLPEHRAVINQLGFNNKGAEVFCEHLKARPAGHIIGANIGKNKDSDDAIADYVTMLEQVHSLCDYVTVNISSPNTEGLRELQMHESLALLLDALLHTRAQLEQTAQDRTPLFIKLAPDMSEAMLQDVTEVVMDKNIDGLILTNTTISRDGVAISDERLKQGGLSGTPLFGPSTTILRKAWRMTEGRVPLIGVGGIGSGADAYEKIKAGASLIQLYTAFTYQGFELVNRINRDLLALMERDGVSHLSEVVGVE